ncbi:MAG TPA: 4-carboxymuconolactone decarboxylase [Candidatus Dormibacteraeota bacterium]
MTDDERRERGMKVRREVLGDEHVDHAQKSATPLTKDFQDLMTRYAWGEIWTRPGLDRRTRSCITVAMTIALNRPEELALHLRGALRNGVTVDELREVLLQTAVYCGVPAAHTAFRIAQEVLEAKDSGSRSGGLT